MNGLLAGEVVKHRGELYNVKAQITVGSATRPPVLVAALGPGNVAALRAGDSPMARSPGWAASTTCVTLPSPR